VDKPVDKIKNTSQPFNSKFESELEKAHSQNYFWIGYSITRNSEHSIFCGSFCCDKNHDLVTLRDIIEGTKKYENCKSHLSSIKKMDLRQINKN